MKITDVYDESNDHKIFLASEARKLENFTRAELAELSESMRRHNVRLCELLKAMRNYAQNPFGKYYIEGESENGTR